MNEQITINAGDHIIVYPGNWQNARAYEVWCLLGNAAAVRQVDIYPDGGEVFLAEGSITDPELLEGISRAIQHGDAAIIRNSNKEA